MMLLDNIYLFAHKGLLLALVLAGFGFLVAIHECGHFFFAKLFGIATPTFSIGMGPVIFRKKMLDTDFCLSLLPLGGYLEIATKPEVGTLILPHGSYFNDKPYWQKLFVMFGGIIFNLISAFLIYCAVFAHGKPATQVNSIIINEVLKSSPADHAGLLKNDIIDAFNEHPLSETKNFSIQETIKETDHEYIIAHVIRSDEEKNIMIKLPQKGADQKIGIQYAAHDYSINEEKLSLIEAIKEGFFTTQKTIQLTYQGIISMFTSRSLQNAGGPVMIFSQSFKMAEQGLKALLLFLAFISINLALINLLPLGALDGGQILLVTIEWIIQRSLPDMIKIGINVVSLGLFAALALYLTFFDILRVFFN